MGILAPVGWNTREAALESLESQPGVRSRFVKSRLAQGLPGGQTFVTRWQFKVVVVTTQDGGWHW